MELWHIQIRDNYLLKVYLSKTEFKTERTHRTIVKV